MPQKTLLNSDHTPTLDELRAFFKENDFSTAAYTARNYDNMPPEDIETLEHIKGLMDEHWEPLSQEMGLKKSHSSYYGKDNPLIAMRDNVQTLVAEGVHKLVAEQPEKAAEILKDFMDEDGDFTVDEEGADTFLHNAVETMMKTMNYEETAKIVQETPAYEDFNHDRYNNHRAVDFKRKWEVLRYRGCK